MGFLAPQRAPNSNKTYTDVMEAGVIRPISNSASCTSRRSATSADAPTGRRYPSTLLQRMSSLLSRALRRRVMRRLRYLNIVITVTYEYTQLN